MAADGVPPVSDPETRAQRSTDQLALALEEVGFDVGRDFPMLSSGLDRDNAPYVELGRVAESVASGLSTVLIRAAQHGVTLDAG
jgi:hypothetical protein